ncbi:protein SULFUR DEFICIENCY-INDUCED 1-like [Bidens hawaiensis]|uniref:protein SULFUR DEFICIENCY-INDUCED 1-like n=1 Tax=Bidens hawaiensis TaxID=980011 RepID=UPI00404B96B2
MNSRFPFSTPQPEKNQNCSSNVYSPPPYAHRPLSEKKWPQSKPTNTYPFHVIHKVPPGDSPYVRAKHVQLVDNNPTKAVSLFWTAINAGDRVDSALKDMSIVMKQLNRSDEAIKSFRHLCLVESQESLDNILLELYKRSGRMDEQIELLKEKLKHIEENTSIDGNQMKYARSQGKKIQITVGQEYSRLLGNLAWAYLQQDDYKVAEEIYRKALSLEPDKNKRCNLAICLMYMKKMTEAKFLLSTVKESNSMRDVDESYAKSYERAIQVMEEIEMHARNPPSFSSFLSRSKETDTIERLSKRCGSDPGYKRSTMSPFPVMGMPRVPFTQPRIQDRKLLHEKPVAEIKKEQTNKKSWADMAEEEEQMMLESRESCYGDENEDCNIMNKEFGSFRMQDGYQSQPGTATCNKSQTVKRSLTFDISQIGNED